MVNFQTVLDAAQQLSPSERWQLVDALWESLPDTADFPLDPAWESELERRLATLKSGEAKTVSWETIRAEAIAKIDRAQ